MPASSYIIRCLFTLRVSFKHSALFFFCKRVIFFCKRANHEIASLWFILHRRVGLSSPFCLGCFCTMTCLQLPVVRILVSCGARPRRQTEIFLLRKIMIRIICEVSYDSHTADLITRFTIITAQNLYNYRWSGTFRIKREKISLSS